MKLKEVLESEVGCLRWDLQQVRDERERLLPQVQNLSAEVSKYKEWTESQQLNWGTSQHSQTSSSQHVLHKTDTYLAIEAKYMKRWKFDSINQEAKCIHTWFPGTLRERYLLEEHLDSMTVAVDVVAVDVV
ncbi:hypothetical protein QVD17_19596 [Tagetes erecta]|uniref:Uncharacterized protein n=1 Tax=Tagetes erecta TaxID=13708 RepID=A0AAD8KNB4_TARER|nr:hypothetical protein QVD17_19596 [Tagetes erecta]